MSHHQVSLASLRAHAAAFVSAEPQAADSINRFLSLVETSENSVQHAEDLLESLGATVSWPDTKTYSDGTSATGTAPLPDQSPAQLDAAQAPAPAPMPETGPTA